MVLLLTTEWIIYNQLSSQGDNVLKIQVLSLFSILFCIAWLLWFIRLGRVVEPMMKSKFYEWLKLFAKLVYWGLGFISTTIAGILIQNHWDQILVWLNKALEAIGKTAV